MDPFVFLIVLFSAVLHALWNSMASKYKNKNVSIPAIVYGHVPACIIAVIVLPLPSVDSIPYIILSAIIHQGYQNFLLVAYQTGKFTTVYPVARGFGPLVATLISIFILGVYLKIYTLISILLISTGIMLIGLFSKSVIKNYKILYTSLATGIFIGIYSIVDGYGARASGSAVSYMSWVFILSALIFPIVLRIRNQKNILKKTLTEGKFIFWVGGFLSYLAYIRNGSRRDRPKRRAPCVPADGLREVFIFQLQEKTGSKEKAKADHRQGNQIPARDRYRRLRH